MNCISMVCAFAALLSFNSAQPAPKTLTVSFDGGPVLELHTESTTGNSPLSTSGRVDVRAGSDARRFVLDKNDKVIFGYAIHVQKSGSGVFDLRIKPLDRGHVPQGENVPSLAAPRDFPHLAVGDAVQVDILYNPATGEKLYDVIKVAKEAVTQRKAAVPSGDLFSLRGFRVVVNGKTIRDTSENWMVGGGLLISMPGRGDYYFGITPCAQSPCRAAAWVDQNVLRFHAGSDLVEVVAKANVLQTSKHRTLWMYHDAGPGPHNAGGQVDFTCGDDVESLIQYRKTQK
jgi:hypothetical protein